MFVAADSTRQRQLNDQLRATTAEKPSVPPVEGFSFFGGVTAPINVDHHAESGARRANYVADNGIYDRDA